MIFFVGKRLLRLFSISIYVIACTFALEYCGFYQVFPNGYATSGVPVPQSTTGKVFRQGLVVDKDNRPTFATYDAYGKVLEVIRSTDEKYTDAFVMTRNEFIDEKQRMSERAINGRLVKTRKQYVAENFVTTSDKPLDEKQALKDSTNSVLIKAPEELYLSSMNPIVEEYRLSKEGVKKKLEDSTVSLIIGKSGDVINQYDNAVAFLTSFKLVDTSVEDLSQYSSTGIYPSESVLYPLKSVRVVSPYAKGANEGRGTITNEFGVYDLVNNYPACFGFHYSVLYNIAAEIEYLPGDVIGGRRAKTLYVLASPSVAQCRGDSALPNSTNTIEGKNQGMTILVSEMSTFLSADLANRYRNIPGNYSAP